MILINVTTTLMIVTTIPMIPTVIPSINYVPFVVFSIRIASKIQEVLKM